MKNHKTSSRFMENTITRDLLMIFTGAFLVAVALVIGGVILVAQL